MLQVTAAGLQRSGETKERRSISSASTPEEIRAFQEQAACDGARHLEEVKATLDSDRVEQAIWRRIFGTYEDAIWIMRVNAFPDGRPMREQNSTDLMLWDTAINALRRYEHGGREH